MKKYLLLFSFLFNVSISSFAQERTIDMQDTVVFNLAQASEAPGYVEFPVYFLSDDTIFSLDFNLKYNTGRFAFDTIINLVPGNLDITYNEFIDTVTTHDTTVLFTSQAMSLQPLPDNTPMVWIRFANLAGGQFCLSDLNSAVGFLNGDACTEKIVACIPNGITDLEYGKNVNSIYPNPATENAVIEFSLTGKSVVTVSVYDIAGQAVYQTHPAEYAAGSQKMNLDLKGLENGVYIIRVNSGNEITSTRITVIR